MLDQEMREPLFDYLDENFGKIRILEEKTIRGSRADVLGVLDGYFVGFEIKSDQDTYERLKTQVKDYDRFCDFCYIVVGASHRKHVAEHVPEHWGILVVTPEGVEMDRGADDNPSARFEDQITLMWKRELHRLLELNDCPKYPNKSSRFITEKLLLKVDHDLLKRQMTELIFERDYTVFDDQPTIAEKKVRRKKAINIKKAHSAKGKAADRARAHTTHYIGAGSRRKKNIKSKGSSI